MTPEQRERLIDELIEGEVNTNGGEGDWFLRQLLRNGFTGFETMTDEELIKTAESAGIETEGLE